MNETIHYNLATALTFTILCSYVLLCISKAQANIDKDNRSPVSHGSAYGESVSSPREKTPSSNDDTKVESDEEEEEQPQTLLKERVSPQLDEDDDTSYLLNFKQGVSLEDIHIIEPSCTLPSLYTCPCT